MAAHSSQSSAPKSPQWAQRAGSKSFEQGLFGLFQPAAALGRPERDRKAKAGGGFPAERRAGTARAAIRLLRGARGHGATVPMPS